MKSTQPVIALLVTFGLSATFSLTVIAQTPSEKLATPTPSAAFAPTAVPALIPYSGTALGSDDRPLTGEIAISFLVFKDGQGGDPVFTETQTVTPDAAGHYKIQLGASLSSGLPADLFANGDARWLEVQIPGQAPQPRSLLVSVPYALKAADATTLGGLPVSAFVLAGSHAATLAAPMAATANAVTGNSSGVTTTGGTQGNLAVFSGASSIANSNLFENSTGVGIGTTAPAATLDVNGAIDLRGMASLFPKGTATTTASANSFPLTLFTSAYNAGGKAAVTPNFAWQAEATGNNTTAPSATLNLLSSAGTAAATETGFFINSNGTVHFAAGQTFPGTGAGTLTEVSAGTGLTGGGATGNVALNVNQSVVAFQTDLAVAEGTLNAAVAAAQSSAVTSAESYTKSNFLNLQGGALTGSLSIQGPALVFPGSSNVLSVVGGEAHNSIGIDGQGIALTGGAGDIGLDGQVLGGNGGQIVLTAGAGGHAYYAVGGNGGNVILNLGQPGSGSYGNGLRGQLIVQGDDDGTVRSMPSQVQIQGSSNPNKQLLLGYLSDGSLSRIHRSAVVLPLRCSHRSHSS